MIHAKYVLLTIFSFYGSCALFLFYGVLTIFTGKLSRFRCWFDFERHERQPGQNATLYGLTEKRTLSPHSVFRAIPRHFDMQVDLVEERAGEAAAKKNQK